MSPTNVWQNKFPDPRFGSTYLDNCQTFTGKSFKDPVLVNPPLYWFAGH